MEPRRIYTCARVDAERDFTPTDVGMAGYGHKPCDRCAAMIWFGPRAERFRALYPTGEIVCMECAAKDLETAGDIQFSAGAELGSVQ